jgi:beta-1,2-mannobiose phosphorylase / 1,2-beta-oligomannan phosphorylase
MLVLVELQAYTCWVNKHCRYGNPDKLIERCADMNGNGGWVKYEGNPVLGGALGTCFDIAVLKDGGVFRMYFSWRPKQSVAVVESTDGLHWSEPVIVAGPRIDTGWEEEINRPVVLKLDGKYLMWYTGQVKPGAEDGNSWIGYAQSVNGITWDRFEKPVLSFDQAWEKNAVMCPHVLWDEDERKFRMWYSGGEQYEPDAIGYAESVDGVHWDKHEGNPVFFADISKSWEQEKVTACQVVKRNGWFLMFYLGFEDVDTSRIGIARSKNGITGWERLKANPILSPDEGSWDENSCYKPYAIFEGDRWMLWYNGRRGNMEQIGAAFHDGEDLGF